MSEDRDGEVVLFPKITIAILVLIVIVLFVVKTNINVNVNTEVGIEIWEEQENAKYVVTFQGKKYYCDHAESPAGYPGKLILYRGDGDYLVLPEKYSVEKVQEKEQKKID